MKNLEIKNSKLDGFRSQIDEVDKNMAMLFEQRMIIIDKICEVKQQFSLPTYDPTREKNMLEKNSQYIKNQKYLESYKIFLSKCLEISKNYQSLKRNKK